MGKLDSPTEFITWFYSKPLLVFGFNVVCIAFIVSTFFDYQALGKQYGDLCGQFCTACNYPGYRADMHGGCQCWGDVARVYVGENLTYYDNKSWENYGCPNRNVTKNMSVIGSG